MNDTTDTLELIERYFAAWNEADPALCRSLVARTWAEDGSYVDPMMEGRGHTEIAAMIGGVRERFPGLRFRLAGAVDAHHACIRFAWELAPESGEPVAKGTDFAALTEDGRLHCVTGFLDTVTAQ